MHRAVIFAGSDSGAPAVLVRGALAAIDSCADLELAGICVPVVRPYLRTLRHHVRERFRRAVEMLLPGNRESRATPPWPVDFRGLARGRGIGLLVPPDGDVNRPDFVARLRDELRPTVALSLHCLQRFGAELLAVFEHAVNCHNGLLPAYRGLRTTAWSRYLGERETGFSFHRMVPGLDAGPVLLQEALPACPSRKTADLDLAKAAAAAARLPQVLRAALDGAPGVPQPPGGRYFSWRDFLAVTRIPDPSALSSAELARRLAAFDRLEIRIAAAWYQVTGVRQLPASAGTGARLGFRTCDGVTVEPVRFRPLRTRSGRG